ncbi:unnamed protein product [Polarella glacialis]|uniref:Uncharacterized protein n=1 Tax=Polarella glacialis TaxID=89957 RepID=A0A813HX66_POLGL|nr:unnamed protein product [Polarella glacialis]
MAGLKAKGSGSEDFSGSDPETGSASELRSQMSLPNPKGALAGLLSLGFVLFLLAPGSVAAPKAPPSVTADRLAADTLSLAQVSARVSDACGMPPKLDDEQSVLSVIQNSGDGVVIIANPQMRCTKAVEAALTSKGAQYSLHSFATSFQYQSGQSAVWDWLHCTYPDDRIEGNGMIMHSYVFVQGKFIGDGFAAAQKIESGQVQLVGLAGGVPHQPPAKSCDSAHPHEAATLHHFMGDVKSKVLLFGWLACPCTGYAQGRFAADGICYEGRTWADPDAKLMKYLQCREGNEDHSFVYTRQGSSWKFDGNGFLFQDSAMPKHQFDLLMASAGAKTSCQHASISRNLYGTPLEECRVGDDMSGSWQDDGTCSEQVGGVHEICIESLPADFSTETHQSSPWSEARAGKRHCVCVGAWSLYMTDAAKHPEQAADIMPHCKAIPETALTKRYLSNWKDWNGYSASVVHGVGELVKRCIRQAGTDSGLQCGLKQHFTALQQEVVELKGAAALQSLEAELAQISCPPGA